MVWRAQGPASRCAPGTYGCIFLNKIPCLRYKIDLYIEIPTNMKIDIYDEYGVNTGNSFNTSPNAKYKLIDIEDESSNECSEPVTKK